MIAFFLPTGGQFPKRTDRPDFRHFVATIFASHNAVLHVDFLCVCVYFLRSRGLPKRPDESLLETAPCRHQFRR